MHGEQLTGVAASRGAPPPPPTLTQHGSVIESVDRRLGRFRCVISSSLSVTITMLTITSSGPWRPPSPVRLGVVVLHAVQDRPQVPCIVVAEMWHPRRSWQCRGRRLSPASPGPTVETSSRPVLIALADQVTSEGICIDLPRLELKISLVKFKLQARSLKVYRKRSCVLHVAVDSSFSFLLQAFACMLARSVGTNTTRARWQTESNYAEGCTGALLGRPERSAAMTMASVRRPPASSKLCHVLCESRASRAREELPAAASLRSAWAAAVVGLGLFFSKQDRAPPRARDMSPSGVQMPRAERSSSEFSAARSSRKAADNEHASVHGQ